MIVLCCCIRRTELLRLCISLSCPSVFTHVSACEIIVVIQFLVSYSLIWSHPPQSSHIVNMHLRFSSLFFPAMNPVPTPNPFLLSFPLSSLFPFIFQLARFHLRRFTLNVLNVDRWGFPAPPLEQNLKNEVWLHVCVFTDVCAFVWLCACLHAFVRVFVYFNRFPLPLGTFWYTLTPQSIIVLFTRWGYLA